MTVKNFLKKAKEIEHELESRRHEKKKHEEESEETWLISYADMMTLLCMFFVMMYTMSEPKKEEYEKVKKEVTEFMGGSYQSPNEKLSKFISNALIEMGVESESILMSDSEGVVVVFQSEIFFDSLGSQFRETGRNVIQKLVDGVVSRQEIEKKKYRVVVEGHTDSRPVTAGRYPSNWELSNARAVQVVRQFLQSGFDPKQMLAIGYGSTRPLYAERDADGIYREEALARNRRVVVRILEPSNDSIPWDIARDPTTLIPTGAESRTPASTDK